MNHPYIKDVLLNNWIDASNTHFQMSELFVKAIEKHC